MVIASLVVATSSLEFTLHALHAWNRSSCARPHQLRQNHLALTCGDRSTGLCILSLSHAMMMTSAGRMFGSRRPTHPAMHPALVASLSSIISTGMDLTSLLSTALRLSLSMVFALPSTLAPTKIYSNIYSALNSTLRITRTCEGSPLLNSHGVLGLPTI